MASSTWAVTQIAQILPLDQGSLQQILDYISTLSKDAAAKHLEDILGDSPKALEFISSFNSRRIAPPVASTSVSEASSAAPRSQTKKKANPPLKKLPAPRQVENQGSTSGAYQKKDEEDYMVGRNRQQRQESALATTLALADNADARQTPRTAPSLKPPPSHHGPLISDLPNVRTGSRVSPRTPSPAPKTTVAVAGGSSMHGASTTLQDLDSAIRALELQTNPSLAATPSQSNAARVCSCNATRHPLLVAAPNCLSCGKIICVKEGIGPCTFCSTPLLSSAELTGMIDSLKRERGHEKMAANNVGQRRADVASVPRAFSTDNHTPVTLTADGGAQPSKTLDLAKQHRDRLLNYQAENARRTHIVDEAADYETPSSGLSQWSSPMERAEQLKRQQKVLREQEWNAKPEYEKRRVVVSVDLVGGKVVKKMGNVDRPKEMNETTVDDGGIGSDNAVGRTGTGGGGAFSRNPLLGNLIRPVWRNKDEVEGKGKSRETDSTEELEGPNKENVPRRSAWRRVQDDDDDNEAMILDGGVYGGRENKRLGGGVGAEEHAYG